MPREKNVRLIRPPEESLPVLMDFLMRIDQEHIQYEKGFRRMSRRQKRKYAEMAAIQRIAYRQLKAIRYWSPQLEFLSGFEEPLHMVCGILQSSDSRFLEEQVESIIDRLYDGEIDVSAFRLKAA